LKNKGDKKTAESTTKPPKGQKWLLHLTKYRAKGKFRGACAVQTRTRADGLGEIGLWLARQQDEHRQNRSFGAT
jgi:hypothetical protein